MTQAGKRVLVVGASGVIGSAVADLLSMRHDVVRIARSSGDYRVDATSVESIEALFVAVGPYDALVTVIGSATMGSIYRLSSDDLLNAFRLKVLAQIDLMRIGLKTIRAGGSFTLSSGVLNKEPMRGYSGVGMPNGAIDSFVRTVALDLKDGVRVNCVSPVFVRESMEKAGVTDPGALPVQSAADTALAYAACVDGDFSGRDLDPRALT